MLERDSGRDVGNSVNRSNIRVQLTNVPKRENDADTTEKIMNRNFSKTRKRSIYRFKKLSNNKHLFSFGIYTLGIWV